MNIWFIRSLIILCIGIFFVVVHKRYQYEQSRREAIREIRTRNAIVETICAVAEFHDNTSRLPKLTDNFKICDDVVDLQFKLEYAWFECFGFIVLRDSISCYINAVVIFVVSDAGLDVKIISGLIRDSGLGLWYLQDKFPSLTFKESGDGKG